ncbi:MAG: SurA N-terminal domain-containing protein [Pseudomonadota bacterium]
MEFFRSLVSNKIVGTLLLGLIILGMAVWGTENIFSGNFGSGIISIGDRSISRQELDRNFERTLRLLRQQDEANRTLTRQQAVEFGLLDREISQQTSQLLFLGYAREIGTDASSQALAETIRSDENFKNQVTGEFDLEAYRRVLANSSLIQQDYEQDLKDGLTISYIEEAISAAIVSPSDLSRIQAIYGAEERRIAWIPLREGALPDVAEPTDDEVREFYESQQAAFTEPERRQISLLAVSAEDFMHLGEFIDEEIETYYEATKTRRLATPEARTFVEAVFADEQTALNAFGTLAGGGDLDGLSATSVETRSGVEDDIAIPEFQIAIFSPGATEGSVVGPFETSAGWLIGQVVSIEPGEPKELEEVRGELEQELSAEQAETEYYNAFNRFDDLIGQGLTIGEIGLDLGVPVLSMLAVDRQGFAADGTPMPVLQQAREGLAEAFELPVNVVSDRIDDADSVYVVSVDSIEPSRVPEFEEIRETVRGRLMATRESEALDTVASAVKSTLESGVSTIEEQADLYGSAVVRPDIGVRSNPGDQTIPRQLQQVALSLNEVGQVAIAQGQLPGEVFVVQLEALNRPSAEELDTLAIIYGAQLAQLLGQDLQQAFQAELQNVLDIEIDTAAIAAYRSAIVDDQ